METSTGQDYTDAGRSALYRVEDLISNNRMPNWEKDFPVIGQGTLIFSIERSSPFFIVVRPRLKRGEEGADQWIALNVYKNKATFTMYMDGMPHVLKEVSGVVKNELVGYEEDRKISYWFSYNRDLLTIKYGKGYRMAETTLMSYDFLDGADPKHTRERMRFLFSPVIQKIIQQYDVEPPELMFRFQAERIIKSRKGVNGLEGESLGLKAHELGKSVIDIEAMVAFDKAPFVSNWSHIVVDSSQCNLLDLDSNKYIFSASLPRSCLELYSNVTAQNVDLDWSPTPSKYRLSDAIRFSLNNPEGILHKKLVSKADEFEGGSFNETYLRVTLGENRGNSPGIPYVLEIWPKGHGSPIHDHGNSYAVIKVLHGGLTIKIFNKQTDSKLAIPLQRLDVQKGDVTWISPDWFQTHQLWNNTQDYCSTIQCYQYGSNDFTEWPYFDYVANTRVIDEFLPDSDFTFDELRALLLEEFEEHMDVPW